MDLVTFLKERLDEDERYARMALVEKPEGSNSVWVMDGKLAIRPSAMPDGLTLHIARHDPARVLREVEAGRRVIAAHPIRPIPNGTCEACSAPDGSSYLADLEEFIDWPCPTLRALAAIWRDHPDYDQGWAP